MIPDDASPQVLEFEAQWDARRTGSSAFDDSLHYSQNGGESQSWLRKWIARQLRSCFQHPSHLAVEVFQALLLIDWIMANVIVGDAAIAANQYEQWQPGARLARVATLLEYGAIVP